jgi:hypothetical protein
MAPDDLDVLPGDPSAELFVQEIVAGLDVGFGEEG